MSNETASIDVDARELTRQRRSIQDAVERRRALEERLRRLVVQAMNDFREETGLAITEVEFDWLDDLVTGGKTLARVTLNVRL